MNDFYVNLNKFQAVEIGNMEFPSKKIEDSPPSVKCFRIIFSTPADRGLCCCSAAKYNVPILFLILLDKGGPFFLS